MTDTPRTGAALGATLDAGFDLGPEHRPLVELCRELERENDRLRRIAAHVPAMVYIAAKEGAGYGEQVRAMTPNAEVALNNEVSR